MIEVAAKVGLNPERNTKAIRIALVRGPFLNPYEMAPYLHLGVGLDAIGFAARRSFTESDATGLEIRQLRCPETEVSIRHGRTLSYFPRFFGASYRLLGLEKALDDVDVIHTAETYFGFSVQSARAAVKLGRPLVVTVKQTIPEVERSSLVRRLGRDADVKQEVRDAAALYVAVSRAAAAALAQEGVPANRIEVVPPAVDFRVFAGRLRSKTEVFRILFVGPAAWHKGVLEAVRALALVRQSRAAQLTIVGDGPELREALRVAERLGIAGAIDIVRKARHFEMPTYYHGSDVLLAPSIPTRTWQEQDSLAVLEAMAAGIPVVATPSGVRKDLLKSEGYWISPGDFLDIAERLLEVEANPGEAARRAAVLQARARDDHDVTVVGAKLAACYRRLGSGDEARTGAESFNPGRRSEAMVVS